MDDTKQTTINIPAGGRFDGRVPVGINGQVSHIPVGVNTPVSEQVLQSLRDSNIEFTEIPSQGGKDAPESGVGSGASSVITPQNANPPKAPDGRDEHKPTDEVPVLKEEAIEPRKDSTETPKLKPASDTGTPANTDGGTGEEPGLLDKSIPDLTEALKSVTDVAEIDKLIAAETNGKSRAGATAALEARKAELATA